MKKFPIRRGLVKSQYSTAIKQREFFIGAILAVAVFTTTTITAVANNSYDVTLYIDGISKTVPAKDITVAEVLRRENVTISPADVVEPSLDTTINADSFKVNVFRARPVLIVDSDQETTVISALNSPKLIAESAGITIYPEDELTLERIDDPVREGQVGQKLIIKRAVVFTVDLYGAPTQFRTTKTTVGDALADKAVVVAETDKIEPTIDQPLNAGSTIKIIKVGQDTLTTDEEIAFVEETVNDENQLKGYVKVEREGKKGLKRITYTVVTNNGAEVSRTKSSEVVVTEPLSSRVIRGTMNPAPAVLGANAAISGSKQEWMAAAGIAQSDWVYADYIMTKESGWRYLAVNPSSGAYGLCQSLPGSKMATAGTDWQTNPVTQLKWCDGYAKGRYGGWANAYNAWLSKHWW